MLGADSERTARHASGWIYGAFGAIALSPMRRRVGLAPSVMSLRSPLSRVLGMGSAKDGTAQWWAQRVTAVALFPLTLWFVFSLLALPDLNFDYRAHLACGSHQCGFLAMLLVAVLAYHSCLGTTVIVEDYVASAGMRVLCLVLLLFLYVLTAGAAIFAILRIVFEFSRS